jgi:hypothetical protein
MTSKRLRRACRIFIQEQLAHQEEFFQLSQEEYNALVAKRDYDGFVLTWAITPAPSLRVIPRTGFRKCMYEEETNNGSVSMPCLIVSASNEILFNLFLELLSVFADDALKVVFESSHNQVDDKIETTCFDDVDPIVLKSKLCDFEDTITNDGEIGIFALNSRPIEVGISNHKLIYIYNWHLADNDVLKILALYGVEEYPEMEFIHEAGHIHHTTEQHFQNFTQLRESFGE